MDSLRYIDCHFSRLGSNYTLLENESLLRLVVCFRLYIDKNMCPGVVAMRSIYGRFRVTI